MAASTAEKLEAKSDMGCGKKDADKKDMGCGKKDMMYGKKDADKKDMMSVKRYSSKKAKMKPEEEEMREGEADKGDGYKNKMDKEGKACSCKHKNDSLTPQEYIAACEMGIQDRSRVYIRARLDAAERMDKTGTGKKCGNSYIPAQANCTAGSGGSAPAKKKPSDKSGQRLRDLQGYGMEKVRARGEFYTNKTGTTKGLGNKLKRGAEFAATLGATAKMYQAGRQLAAGQIGRASQSFLSGAALSSAASGSRAQRQGRTALARDFNRQAGQLVAAKAGVTALQAASKGINPRQVRNSFVRNRAKASNAAFSVEQRLKGFRKMKRDGSVWADGFSPANSKYDI